ncbi:High potential iron-sulfur protein [Luteibacter sp. UNCMF331Sha3.1]|uniref:high-potential iron-sulfur protein n=1 Tax=Luteibacter sp. UNCMF331Sha3.1 TaxID=1502760 RepID=UPI0004928628|nr:high-potential iron-sulfur protein [Luteibacter sp. UNCMF331Sha3.1]SEN14684.1 High potential iron-sulfur protein [Luteibacter sp. UNCMF331Sha3.1]
MTHRNDPSIEGRRRFLKAAAGGAAAVAVLGTTSVALAQDLPHLSPTDPTATALKYTEAETGGPGRKPGDKCSNCNFYQGKADAAWGPCQLFPGKAVAAKGWCVSHVLAT